MIVRPRGNVLEGRALGPGACVGRTYLYEIRRICVLVCTRLQYRTYDLQYATIPIPGYRGPVGNIGYGTYKWVLCRSQPTQAS